MIALGCNFVLRRANISFIKGCRSNQRISAPNGLAILENCKGALWLHDRKASKRTTFDAALIANVLAQVVIRLRVEREAHVARKAAAMRRQMAAEVSAAGAGQEAAAIVHSIVSEDGSFSAGGGANSGGGDGGSLAGGMSAEGITSGLPGGGEGSGDGFDEGGSEAGNVDASRGGPSMFDVRSSR